MPSDTGKVTWRLVLDVTGSIQDVAAVDLAKREMEKLAGVTVRRWSDYHPREDKPRVRKEAKG
jgi:hypothetical protein